MKRRILFLTGLFLVSVPACSTTSEPEQQVAPEQPAAQASATAQPADTTPAAQPAASAEARTAAAAAQPAAAEAQPAIDDAELLDAAKAYVVENPIELQAIKITVERREGDFARLLVQVRYAETRTSAATLLFMKHDGKSWRAIHFGTDFSCEDHASDGVPASLCAD